MSLEYDYFLHPRLGYVVRHWTVQRDISDPLGSYVTAAIVPTESEARTIVKNLERGEPANL